MHTPTDQLIRRAIWAVLCAGIALITWSVVAPAPVPDQLVEPPEPAVTTVDSAPAAGLPAELPEPTPTAAPETVVYVTGAVARPGLYALAASSRVGAAVTAAGGLTADAAFEQVNMAAHVSDAAHIHIPRAGEGVGAPVQPDAPAAGSAGVPVAVNEADATTLTSLPGVGASLAERIVAYRAAHGPFRSLADLDAVSGIGAALLQKLEPLIRF